MDPSVWFKMLIRLFNPKYGPCLGPNQKKEMIILILLVTSGWNLSLYPELPPINQNPELWAHVSRFLCGESPASLLSVGL